MIFNEIKKPVSLETTLSVAKGSAQGLGQALLANDGQPAKTVLAVGYTNTGKVQGVSLGDGNVVEVNGVAVSSINDFKATIPTDSTTDLTPVLTAISNLNDITPADARSAFNEADFKDKNTELEIHNWLDSYTNKDNWKESATVDADVVATAVWDKVIE
jgi:hypothetical protein